MGLISDERQLSRVKLRGEPATRWIDKSFTISPKSDDLFACQNSCGPLSVSSGLVLSGHRGVTEQEWEIEPHFRYWRFSMV